MSLPLCDVLCYLYATWRSQIFYRVDLNVWLEMSDIFVRAGGQNVAQVGTLSYVTLINVLKQRKLRLCQYYLVKPRTVYSDVYEQRIVIFAG
jgi:hypothetical protein